MLLRTPILLVVVAVLVCSGVADAQQVTQNQFVSVKEINGLLTIYKGPPANGDALTYADESFLTVEVNGLYYSDNPNAEFIGSNGNTHPPDVTLANPQTAKIKDTLRTIWQEQGFDIVQDAFPVAFTSSGVIVISVKIVNHLTNALPAQAEYLLDNFNSDAPDSANDNPFIINRYGYIRNWQECPPNPIPSFFLAFEYAPSNVKLGTVGIGYLNDTFVPRR